MFPFFREYMEVNDISHAKELSYQRQTNGHVKGTSDITADMIYGYTNSARNN